MNRKFWLCHVFGCAVEMSSTKLMWPEYLVLYSKYLLMLEIYLSIWCAQG